MKLKAFAKWLKESSFRIDTEEKGLILAHFIHSKYPIAVADGLEVILTLDVNDNFVRVYDKLLDLPSLTKEDRKKFIKAQNEILQRPLAITFKNVTKEHDESKATPKRTKYSNNPTSNRARVSTRKTKRIKSPGLKAHRYNTESYYQPVRTISANGLVTVDSRYAKLHEDYDDK